MCFQARAQNTANTGEGNDTHNYTHRGRAGRGGCTKLWRSEQQRLGEMCICAFVQHMNVQADALSLCLTEPLTLHITD